MPVVILRSMRLLMCLCLLLHASRLIAEAPRTTDPRLVIELFAEHPGIVTPTGIDVDASPNPRVFVAESHTHFRPDDYDGPSSDRILIFQDTDGDGQADLRTVFYEGFTHVMDVAFRYEGEEEVLYVATRMDIHRLRDTDGDNHADEVKPIVVMETTGTYPHNGISGLAFHSDGSFNFGLGENLGHEYTLIGSDGTRINGGGEGGSTYHVQADGSRMRRVSTGWWNPWGMCVDAYGRVFGTDNDPGASPPCRLIQVIEGGNYGFEYRYGRTGLHPFISWTGQLPGTLPMIAGTGEAPCGIIAYQGSMFPPEYRNQLVLASWADHRIECYPLTQLDSSGLVITQRNTLVEGDNEFRPVGVALGADGSLYVSDWVSSSYQLHGLGRIWRIRASDGWRRENSTESKSGANSASSRVSPTTVAAPQRAIDKTRINELRAQDTRLADHDRALALQELVDAGDEQVDYRQFLKPEYSIPMRNIALQYLAKENDSGQQLLPPAAPVALRATALLCSPLADEDFVAEGLASRDPVLFHAGVTAPARLRAQDPKAFSRLDKRYPVAGLLAMRQGEIADEQRHAVLKQSLACANPNVQFIAMKWIADELLISFRSQVEQLLEEPNLQYRTFLAVSATLDRLDGKEPVDRPSDELLWRQIQNDNAPVTIRKLAVRLINPQYKKSTLGRLINIASGTDAALAVEALRTLAGHTDGTRLDCFRSVADDSAKPAEVRVAAMAGLAPVAGDDVELMVKLAATTDRAVSQAALQVLAGAVVSEDQSQRLRKLVSQRPEWRESVDRIVSGSPGLRPDATDIDGWLNLIQDSGDAAAGQHVFLSPTVGSCSRCHQVQGRGIALGPDLTQMSQRLAARGDDGKRWLLETILLPSKDMAPQYTPWSIVTTDGQVLIGLPRRKGGSQEAYLGLDGKEFTVKKHDIEVHHEMNKSIMPDGLLQQLTLNELRDLLAFLAQPVR